MKHTKTAFEPHENLQVAWMHYFLGIDQHLIASSFAINSGRVNEACRAIEYAMKDPKRVLAILDRVFKPAPEQTDQPPLPLPNGGNGTTIPTFAGTELDRLLATIDPVPWEKQQ